MNDTRQKGKVLHRLTDILFIVASGIICGYDEWDTIHNEYLLYAVFEYIRLKPSLQRFFVVKTAGLLFIDVVLISFFFTLIFSRIPRIIE